MAVHVSFLLLILAWLTGIYSITTVSKVSVKAGSKISIPCLYEAKYKNNVKYLCQGGTWNFCKYAIKTNQPESQKFSISDDKKQGIFTVTIKRLVHGDAGYYWCAVEINNGPDDGKYFHLSVTGTPSLYVQQQMIQAFNRGNTTIECHHQHHGGTMWCRLGGKCVTFAVPSIGSIDGTSVTISKQVNVFTVTMSGLKMTDSGWYLCVEGDLQMPVHLTVAEQLVTSQAPTTVHDDQRTRDPVDVKSYIIPLSLLIVIVAVALFIWFMLKRHKQTKFETSTTMTAEDEVTYSDVTNVKKSASKKSDAKMKSDEDVVYSSVVQ